MGTRTSGGVTFSKTIIQSLLCALFVTPVAFAADAAEESKKEERLEAGTRITDKYALSLADGSILLEADKFNDTDKDADADGLYIAASKVEWSKPDAEHANVSFVTEKGDIAFSLLDESTTGNLNEARHLVHQDSGAVLFDADKITLEAESAMESLFAYNISGGSALLDAQQTLEILTEDRGKNGVYTLNQAALNIVGSEIPETTQDATEALSTRFWALSEGDIRIESTGGYISSADSSNLLTQRGKWIYGIRFLDAESSGANTSAQGSGGVTASIPQAAELKLDTAGSVNIYAQSKTADRVAALYVDHPSNTFTLSTQADIRGKKGVFLQAEAEEGASEVYGLYAQDAGSYRLKASEGSVLLRSKAESLTGDMVQSAYAVWFNGKSLTASAGKDLAFATLVASQKDRGAFAALVGGAAFYDVGKLLLSAGEKITVETSVLDSLSGYLSAVKGLSFTDVSEAKLYAQDISVATTAAGAQSLTGLDFSGSNNVEMMSKTFALTTLAKIEAPVHAGGTEETGALQAEFGSVLGASLTGTTTFTLNTEESVKIQTFADKAAEVTGFLLKDEATFAIQAGGDFLLDTHVKTLTESFSEDLWIESTGPVLHVSGLSVASDNKSEITAEGNLVIRAEVDTVHLSETKSALLSALELVSEAKTKEGGEISLSGNRVVLSAVLRSEKESASPVSVETIAWQGGKGSIAAQSGDLKVLAQSQGAEKVSALTQMGGSLALSALDGKITLKAKSSDALRITGLEATGGDLEVTGKSLEIVARQTAATSDNERLLLTDSTASSLSGVSWASDGMLELGAAEALQIRAIAHEGGAIFAFTQSGGTSEITSQGTLAFKAAATNAQKVTALEVLGTTSQLTIAAHDASFIAQSDLSAELYAILASEGAKLSLTGGCFTASVTLNSEARGSLSAVAALKAETGSSVAMAADALNLSATAKGGESVLSALIVSNASVSGTLSQFSVASDSESGPVRAAQLENAALKLTHPSLSNQSEGVSSGLFSFSAQGGDAGSVQALWAKNSETFLEAEELRFIAEAQKAAELEALNVQGGMLTLQAGSAGLSALANSARAEALSTLLASDGAQIIMTSDGDLSLQAKVSSEDALRTLSSLSLEGEQTTVTLQAGGDLALTAVGGPTSEEPRTREEGELGTDISWVSALSATGGSTSLSGGNVTLFATASLEKVETAAVRWASDQTLTLAAEDALSIEALGPTAFALLVEKGHAKLQGTTLSLIAKGEGKTEALRITGSDDAPSVQLTASDLRIEALGASLQEEAITTAVLSEGNATLNIEGGAVSIRAENPAKTASALLVNRHRATSEIAEEDAWRARLDYDVAIRATEQLTLTGDRYAVFADGDTRVLVDSLKASSTTVSGAILAVHGASVELQSGQNAALEGAVYAFSEEGQEETSRVALTLNEGAVFSGHLDDFGLQDAQNRDVRTGNLMALTGGATPSGEVLSNALTAGEITLTMNKATWVVTENSWLTNLIATDSHLYFKNGGAAPEDYHQVTVQNFTGDINTVTMSINMRLDSETLANDQLRILNESGAIYHVRVVIDDEDLTETKSFSENYLISYREGGEEAETQGEDSSEKARAVSAKRLRSAAQKTRIAATDLVATSSVLQVVSDPTSANGSTNSYQLTYVGKDDDLEALSQGAESTGDGTSGYWHLLRVETEEASQEDPTVDTPEVQTVKDLGTSYGPYLAWRSDLTDLRTRLGSVRAGSPGGLWVQGIYERERASAVRFHEFKQTTRGVHIGLDRALATESGSWLFGGSLRLAHTTRKNTSELTPGSGSLDQYTAKLYASYLGNSGFYTDLVLQAGLFEEENTWRNNVGDGAARAHYRTQGAGASLEAGYRFKAQTSDGAWFAEPQVEAAFYRIRGKDFRMSSGMRISQSDVDSVIGRAGLFVGKTFGDKEAGFTRGEAALKAGVKHEFKGAQTVRLNNQYTFDAKLGGTTMYYGLQAEWRPKAGHSLFLNLERETGSRYRKDAAFNLTYRYSF